MKWERAVGIQSAKKLGNWGKVTLNPCISTVYVFPSSFSYWGKLPLNWGN